VSTMWNARSAFSRAPKAEEFGPPRGIVKQGALPPVSACGQASWFAPYGPEAA